MDFEQDPAADFLNREREELAGIINDTEGKFNILHLIGMKFTFEKFLSMLV